MIHSYHRQRWHVKERTQTIIRFAKSIDQDPGIVLGRLMKDGRVDYKETYLSNRLRHKYKVVIV